MKTGTSRRRVGAIAALCLSAALRVAVTEAAVLRADLNGDGFEDLVVGSPHEDVGSVRDAGAVSVFYGKTGGPEAQPSQQWHQDTPGIGGAPGIAGAAETGDLFGYAVAVGDFDGDGFDDLAVGVPGEAIAGVGAEAGVVNVIYGSTFGLQLRRNAMLTLGAANQDGAYFGSSLAVGDFNGDGFEDLAVGASAFSRPPDKPGCGAAMVFFGGSGGLRNDGRLTFGTQQQSENGDSFAWVLAAADFDRDGYDDLAVGIPEEDFGSRGVDQGAVEILYGGVAVFRGSDLPRSHLLRDEGSGAAMENLDAFGSSLATGDFNCDGYPDLAVGHPGEDAKAVDEGAVTIVYGGPFGANGGIRDYWPASRAGMPDKAERGDQLGWSLAAADFDRDACDDLAIGVPFEDQERLLGDRPDVGRVAVLNGGRSGLVAGARSDWHQDKGGVASTRASRDRFGWSLGVGDFDRDGTADLVVGVPGETVYLSTSPPVFRKSAGMLHVFYGTRKGLSSEASLGRETFTEALRGSATSQVERDDQLGFALP